MTNKRNYGILMPIASLPSQEGIGTLGRDSYRFVDYLADSRAEIWQILPLNPTNYGDSPYQSCCSNALNYYFIDLETLVEYNLLTRNEVDSVELGSDKRRVNYSLQFYNKISILRKAFERFDKTNTDFRRFIHEGEYNDFSAFMSLKCKFDHKSWIEWDEPYRTFDENLVDSFVRDNRNEFEFWQFTQFIFLLQWNALKDYAHSKGVSIMGDIPLYLAYDSVEMWKYGGKLFKVDANRRPLCVAGVPPDMFSEDGQLWGNPVYDWRKMKNDGYEWWNGRLKQCLKLFDIVRVDHFRGFDRYYEIPFGATTARNGIWVDGPKMDFFADKLDYNIVAEDLGVVDEGILLLMKNVGYPGMKILEFAFDGVSDNDHKPSKITENFVCYTGTHDNMPLKQYLSDLSKRELKTFIKDLKSECEFFRRRAAIGSFDEMCKTVIELAFCSRANTVVIPMWDLLAMGGEARINFPSTLSTQNWSWRFVNGDFTTESSAYLKELATETNR